MGYNRNKPKKKKGVHYRFEGRQLTDLPADVPWLQMVATRKVESEWLTKYPYWFERGTYKWLRETRDLEEEARARRTHAKITRKNIVKDSWWQRIIKFLKQTKWPFNLQPR